ncbi:MAG: glutamyl-tRNA reductase [Desulfotomaculales bacterium]
MFLFVVGLNHRTAPVEVRERLSFTQQGLEEALQSLSACPGVEGCVVLFTCNRTEIYVSAGNLEAGLNAVRDYLSRLSGVGPARIKDYTYTHTLSDAARHLFRVAAGLDSMLLGEPQILGQVSDAYQFARERGFTGKVLNVLFQQAVAAGKKVRKATGIDQNAVSISYAAVELARQELGDLNGRSVLVIGAGKMSGLAARYLVANGVSGVIVSNRSYDRAVALAREFGGRAVRFDRLYECLLEAEIVISCTAAAHYVVHYEQVAQVLSRRPGARILMVDIAVPRDVDPRVGTLPGVTLYDIDDLQKVVDQNLAWRRQLAGEAEKIIAAELVQFQKWLGAQAVVPVIAALKEKAEKIKQSELRRALNRLGDLSPHHKKVVSSLAGSVINQLLHAPVTRLKEYSLSPEGHLYAEALQKLFDLSLPGEEGGGKEEGGEPGEGRASCGGKEKKLAEGR